MINANENDNVSNFYSNKLEIEVGLYDFRFGFTQINGNLENNERINIIMSPQHAKAITNLLNDVIKKYEKDFGEINLPKEFNKQLEK